MRRQSRISVGGALVVRTASPLQVWLWLLIFVFQNEFRISSAIQPGYLDFDNLPETNFTCAGKVIGGYYADLETSCQMFHVCTVGTENETMDIKFLCLNGTVFDQETRVCERVDEVDCTKSEKFYSLNLELYGSTAPPIIQPEQVKPHTKPTEQPHDQVQQTTEDKETDIALDEAPTTSHEKVHIVTSDTVDSTEDPVHEFKKETHQNANPAPSQDYKEPIEEIEEFVYSEAPEYEEYYTHSPTSTTTTPLPTTTSTTTTTTTTTVSTTTAQSTTSKPRIVSPQSLPLATHSPPVPISISSVSSLPTLDPAVLTPEEFTYQHRGPGSEAISFQRQSFRPADGIFITHAPPNQFEYFPYESSRTAPRATVQRPTAFVQRPQPSPFRATTLGPNDQLLRPGSQGQPSEHRHHSHRQNIPFDPFHYQNKRSDDSTDDTVEENESFLTARSVAPPPVTERRPYKPKGLPRVIVTASASVSDSNGRRLNYTVGNVVSAVKPIAQINYDDYKESDIDPFYLDVPKLKRRRKSRSNRNKQLFTVPAVATATENVQTNQTTTKVSVTSSATTTEKVSNISETTITTSTSTVAWNPNDYVDDNYEAHIVPPAHPLALLVPHDLKRYSRPDNKSVNHLFINKNQQDHKSNVGRVKNPRPTSSATQISSSQITTTKAGTATPPLPATDQALPSALLSPTALH